MATTVTIDERTQEKLDEVKALLLELGDPEFFKTDIVRNLVDDMHVDVRETYYEAQAEPYIRSRRNDQHADLLEYWTRNRITTELFHAGYRDEYADAYGNEGDTQYATDIRDTFIQIHQWLEQHDPGFRVSEPVVADRDDNETPIAYAVMYRDDAFFVERRGIGNACEIAVRRMQSTAQKVLEQAGADAVDDPWCGAYLVPASFITGGRDERERPVHRRPR